VRNQAAGELAQNLGSETAAAAPLAAEGCSSDMFTFEEIRETSVSPVVNDMKARLELIYSISILADFLPTTQRIFILCTTLHVYFIQHFFLEYFLYLKHM
jgi:hypothetical protein